jgi:hypothetical protein
VDQVVTSYTVPAGRNFVLGGFTVQCRSTSPPGNANPVLFGTASLEVPGGSKRFTYDFMGNVSPSEHGGPFADEWIVPAGTVVRIVCTPIAATSFLWRANLWGSLA